MSSDNKPTNPFTLAIMAAVPMKQVCEMYGIEVNRQKFACCPFHSEKTPSMKIYDNDGGFFCFGCHAGGNVVNFVERYFDLTFWETIVKMNSDFSLGLPVGRPPTLREKRLAEKRKKEIEAKKEERNRLQAEYDKALADYIAIDKQFNEYKPKSPDEPPHPLFIEALQKKDNLSLKLDEAEDRLRNYDNR